MKVIGLIGGMSWESSQEYYRIINERTREKLGGLHSARSLMYSVDFDEIERLQHNGEWDSATSVMINAARRLEAGGADMIVICTNTMHKMADDVQAAVHITLHHIADATAKQIKAAGYTKVGLLGTKFTMEEDFYKGRLTEKYGLEVIVPDETDRQTVHDIIYKELCLGVVTNGSREKYIKIIKHLTAQGAQAVILGCTEITLLINQDDVSTPVFDTTKIHAETAVDIALT